MTNIKGKGFRTNRLSQKVRQILQTHGDKKIIGATITRNPIMELWTRLFSILTFGEFKRRLEQTPYDELFHLRLDVELDDFTIIGIEKLDIINMDRDPKLYEASEEKQITNMPKGLTINTIMEKTHEYMGPKFYTYSAFNNNCQDFVKAILISNNIGDKTDLDFVKQDIKSLSKDLNFLRKFSNTATDITAYIKMLIDNIPFTRKEQVELLSLQEKTEPKYIVGGAMVSEIELEAKIRGILKGILMGNEGKLSGTIEADLKRKYPKKSTVAKGSKEAKERMAKVRAAKANTKAKDKTNTKTKTKSQHLVKGSKEAKERMAKVRAARKA